MKYVSVEKDLVHKNQVLFYADTLVLGYGSSCFPSMSAHPSNEYQKVLRGCEIGALTTLNSGRLLHQCCNLPEMDYPNQ